MQITKDLVKHIAKLARINLASNEEEKFTKQMGDIVGFVESLNEVDTKGVEETNQVNGMENVLREDEIKPFEAMGEIIKQCKHPIEDNQIKVKKSI